MQEYITWLLPTIGLKIQEPCNLFQNLECGKVINSMRKLSAEAEKKMTLVEKKLQDNYVDRLDPEF